MTTTNGLCPRGAVDFRAISDNILEECATSDDVLSPDIDGICESGHFTVPGMVALVERSIDLLEKAHMYEMMYPAFKVNFSFINGQKKRARTCVLAQPFRLSPPETVDAMNAILMSCWEG